MTLAVALAEGSAWLTTEIVAVAGVGRICGAANVALSAPFEEGVMVPTMLLPPAMPLTLQITDTFIAFVTVAVNCSVCPRKRASVPGVSETVTGGDGGL